MTGNQRTRTREQDTHRATGLYSFHTQSRDNIMDIRNLLITFLSLPLIVGCVQSTTEIADTDSSTAAPNGDAQTNAEPAPADVNVPSKPSTITRSIGLTAENTTIEFVGSHAVDEEPDPNARHGVFKAFSGAVKIADGKLLGVSLEIETGSLDTEIEKLNGHLKSADFFDVREHPQASFVSTAIEPAEEGQVTITGELTMLKTTKSISFPATVNTDGPFELTAEFTIDRTDFGMTFGPDKVRKDVAMMVKIRSS